MRKTIKALIIGAISIVLGGIIVFTAFAISGFNIFAFSAEKFTQVTTSIDQEVDKITVTGTSFDVVFLPSSSADLKVVADETEDIKHTVKVEKGELKITTVDNRKWYQHIGFFFHDHKAITVYLPNTQDYNINVNTQSADIKMQGITATTINLKAESGDVEVQNLAIAQNVSVTTLSGDVNMRGVRAKNLTVTCESGDTELNDVVINEKTNLTSKSGGVELNGCDSGSYFIKTKSGDVEGNILTSKNFTYSTNSGRVRLPSADPTAGVCRIETKSGDIEIRLGLIIDD